MSDGNDTLRKNLLDQQERLFQQLADLEEIKEEMDSVEFEESKSETLEQIADIAASLEKMVAGNLSLTDQIGSQKQLTQNAIREAFHTPDVIRLFARREPEALKQRLRECERDFKLSKLSDTTFRQDKRELLTALKHIGEILNGEQEAFLSLQQEDKSSQFEEASETNMDVVNCVLGKVKRGGYSSSTN